VELVVLRKFIFLCCLLPLAAHAEIYKWTDSSGRTHFSDKPVGGAKEVRIQSMTGISNPAFNLERNAMRIKYQNKNGSMIVQGRVNNINMQFVVDTGASLVIIPPNIAKRAHISTVNAKTITLQTANGATQSYMVNISSLQVSQLHQKSVHAAIQQVSPDPNLGLLGMSFLNAYKMSIDHDQQVITLEPR